MPYRDDHPDGPWDPQPVQTTIEFRDQQALYTFPVGVTTLWWYAPNQGNSLGEDATFTFGNYSSDVSFEQRIKGTGSANAEDVESEPWDEPIYGDAADEQTRLFRFRRQL